MNYAKFLIKNAMEKVSARWARRAMALAQRSGDVPGWFQRHGFDMTGRNRRGLLDHLSTYESGKLSRRALEEYTRSRRPQFDPRSRRMLELALKRSERLGELGRHAEAMTLLSRNSAGLGRSVDAVQLAHRDRLSEAIKRHSATTGMREDPSRAFIADDPLKHITMLPSGYARAKRGYTPGHNPAKTLWRGTTFGELVSPEPNTFFTAHPAIAGGYGELVMKVPRASLPKSFFTPHFETPNKALRKEMIRRRPEAGGQSQAGKLVDYELVTDPNPAATSQLYSSKRLGLDTEAKLLTPLTVRNRQGKYVPYTGRQLQEQFAPIYRNLAEYSKPVWTWPEYAKHYGQGVIPFQ
jgi:hypothetical protein